jgi:hypothetical protein
VLIKKLAAASLACGIWLSRYCASHLDRKRAGGAAPREIERAFDGIDGLVGNDRDREAFAKAAHALDVGAREQRFDDGDARVFVARNRLAGLRFVRRFLRTAKLIEVNRAAEMPVRIRFGPLAWNEHHSSRLAIR